MPPTTAWNGVQASSNGLDHRRRELLYDWGLGALTKAIPDVHDYEALQDLSLRVDFHEKMQKTE